MANRPARGKWGARLPIIFRSNSGFAGASETAAAHRGHAGSASRPAVARLSRHVLNPAVHGAVLFLHALINWFDSGFRSEVIPPVLLRASGQNRSGSRCVPFAILHAGCLGGDLDGLELPGLPWGCRLPLFRARMFAVTGFFHRYFSHRTFLAIRGMAVHRASAVWGGRVCSVGRSGEHTPTGIIAFR